MTALDGKKVEEAKKVDPAQRTADQTAMVEGEIGGSRKTLRYDAILPIGMGIIYLMLLLYFRTIGGYKPLSLEKMAGGVEGPVP